MATNLPDGGTTNSGSAAEAGGATTAGDAGNGGAGVSNDGIATETGGRATSEAEGNAEYYSKEIDQKITKIRPMATPVDQISRYATASKADSFIVKYYSVGTRPVKTHLSWARNVLDLKKAGIRNTDAVVIQEVACLYLRYPKAHARMQLSEV